MKRYILGVFLLFTAFGFCSCEAFLDAEPQDKVSDISFWKSESDVSKFITDIYASTYPLVYEGSIFFNEALSDNAYLVYSGWYTDVKFAANGTQDAYGTMPQELWRIYYANIRKCWQVFENIDRVSGLNDDNKNILLAQTRFLLAWNYHRLVAFFGDVPLVKKVLTIGESKELTRTPRSQVVEFILNELDLASEALVSATMEKGQISWGACQMLKARIYQNENRYSELLAVTDGLLGKYSLETSGETPYENLFSGAAEDSPEIIFSIIRERTSGSIETGHRANQIFFLKGMSGGDAFRAITPSGSLVDAYPMADGRLIHENGSTYDPKNPYKDRDPRLAQTIVYPGQQLKYLDASANVVKETLYDPEVATTIPEQQYNAKEPSSTGYMWNKYVDWSAYAMTQIRDCSNDIIVMRYAETLLMRAEALAETQGAAAKKDIIDLINQLRNRCHGGTVHAENYNSKEELIGLVHNERRIELANEGLRYFDLLRWRAAEKSPMIDGEGLKGDFYGAYMRLDGVGSGDVTVTVDGVARRYVETRFFEVNKHYLQPIPQKERELNTNLEQNPNW